MLRDRRCTSDAPYSQEYKKEKKGEIFGWYFAFRDGSDWGIFCHRIPNRRNLEDKSVYSDDIADVSGPHGSRTSPPLECRPESVESYPKGRWAEKKRLPVRSEPDSLRVFSVVPKPNELSDGCKLGLVWEEPILWLVDPIGLSRSVDKSSGALSWNQDIPNLSEVFVTLELCGES